MSRRKGLGTGKGQGYSNMVSSDSKVHSDSAMGKKQPQKVCAIVMTGKIPQRSMFPEKKLTDRQYSNRFYDKKILDSIDGSNYGKNLKTDKEKLEFLKETFKSEYGFNIQRMGERKAFSEWLQGLPSAINLPFYNDDILKLARESKSIPQKTTESYDRKIIDGYYDFMTNKIFKLFEKNNIK